MIFFPYFLLMNKINIIIPFSKIQLILYNLISLIRVKKSISLFLNLRVMNLYLIIVRKIQKLYHKLI